MLLDDGGHMRKETRIRNDHRLSKHGPALGATDVKNAITELGEVS